MAASISSGVIAAWLSLLDSLMEMCSDKRISARDYSLLRMLMRAVAARIDEISIEIEAGEHKQDSHDVLAGKHDN